MPLGFATISLRDLVPNPLWFWELPRRDMGVWLPIYSGFPRYADGRFVWPHDPPQVLSWLRVR